MSALELLEKHGNQFGSGFLAKRNGEIPGTECSFGPPESFLAFLKTVPDTLLHSGQNTEAGDAEWKAYAVPFYQDGCGNAYFFDTRESSPDGEYPILVWKHDDPDLDPTELHEAADDFPSWLDEYLPVAPCRTSAKTSGNHQWGIIALLVGALALTLGILADREQKEIAKIEQQHAQGDGITFTIKDVAITLGKKEPKVDLPPVPEASPLQPACWVVGIIGLVLAPLSWVKEKQKVLSCSAAALCIAGLAWQYVPIAIGLALLIILLSAFS